MLEVAIWFHVVYNQGIKLAVLFTPVVALNFVLSQELVIISFVM